LISAQLGTDRPALGRLRRTVLAAVVLGAGLGLMRLGGAPLGALVAAGALGYPALLIGLRALELDDLRVVLRRGATA
jgi:hypothetical protein